MPYQPRDRRLVDAPRIITKENIMKDLKTLSTKELVELYNKHSEKKVTKFSDRATAEKRVAALLATLKPVKEPVKKDLVHSGIVGLITDLLGKDSTQADVMRAALKKYNPSRKEFFHSAVAAGLNIRTAKNFFDRVTK